MSKFQIEKVDCNTIYPDCICCVIDYYPALDSVGQINYTSEEYGRENKFYRSVGMWKIKLLKNN